MSRASALFPRASGLCLGVMLLLSGCSSSRQTSQRPPSPEEVFPTPQGWFNFSADSSRHTLAWFVRDDYKAEIIIEAMSDDRPVERPRVDVGQLTALARAVFSMDTVSGEKVLQQPERGGAGENDRWSYVLENSDGDRLRVVIAVSDRYGIVRSATTVLADQGLRDVEKVQDALLAGPIP